MRPVGCGHRSRAAVRSGAARHAHHHPRADQVLRWQTAVRELRPRPAEAPDRVDLRPQWLRQVDADQHDRRADPHRQRTDPVRRQIAARDQDRLRVPELSRRDVSMAAHGRQHRLSAQARRAHAAAGGAAGRGAGRVVRREVRPHALSLRALGRAAADHVDHARAGTRAGGAVPGRAVLRAGFRNDAVHPGKTAGRVHADRDDHGRRVARSRRRGLPRGQGAAADQASDAHRRDRSVRGSAAADDRHACQRRASSAPRRARWRSSSAKSGAEPMDAFDDSHRSRRTSTRRRCCCTCPSPPSTCPGCSRTSRASRPLRSSSSTCPSTCTTSPRPCSSRARRCEVDAGHRRRGPERQTQRARDRHADDWPRSASATRRSTRSLHDSMRGRSAMPRRSMPRSTRVAIRGRSPASLLRSRICSTSPAPPRWRVRASMRIVRPPCATPRSYAGCGSTARFSSAR